MPSLANRAFIATLRVHQAIYEASGGWVGHRLIVRPTQLHAHLNKVLMVGMATDFEEFAQNLCCFAAPVKGRGGKVEGAIGLSATTRRVQSEGQQLIELVQWAATEATTLLVDATYGGRSSA